MARPTALALVPPARQTVPLRYSVIVCAYNEEAFLSACLHSLLAQTRRPDEILVVNNASSDNTRAVALRVPGVRVIDEPRRGLVRAREAGRQADRVATCSSTLTPIVARPCSGWRAWQPCVRAANRRPCRDRTASTTGTCWAHASPPLRLDARAAHTLLRSGPARDWRGALRRQLCRAPRGPRSHRWIRHLDRVSWRGYEPGSPTGRGWPYPAVAVLLDLHVRTTLPGDGARRRVWPLHQEFLVRDSSDTAPRMRPIRM